jgi:hypothetical protein
LGNGPSERNRFGKSEVIRVAANSLSIARFSWTTDQPQPRILVIDLAVGSERPHDVMLAFVTGYPAYKKPPCATILHRETAVGCFVCAYVETVKVNKKRCYGRAGEPCSSKISSIETGHRNGG